MRDYSLDDYFELALDLPQPQRERLLEQLDAQDAQLAHTLRDLLDRFVRNPDFLCRRAAGDADPAAAPTDPPAAPDDPGQDPEPEQRTRIHS